MPGPGSNIAQLLLLIPKQFGHSRLQGCYYHHLIGAPHIPKPWGVGRLSTAARERQAQSKQSLGGKRQQFLVDLPFPSVTRSCLPQLFLPSTPVCSPARAGLSAPTVLPSPPTLLTNPGAAGSPRPQPVAVAMRDPSLGPHGATLPSASRSWSHGPQPVISGWAPEPLPHRPHPSGPPSTSTTKQPGLRLLGWPSHPGEGFQRPGPYIRRASAGHLPLRHQLQPHLTPPSLAATLGTIPTAHWLLPRQPGATPLPIGSAQAQHHLCAGLRVSRAPGWISDREMGLSPRSHLGNPDRALRLPPAGGSKAEMSTSNRTKQNLRQTQQWSSGHQFQRLRFRSDRHSCAWSGCGV